MHGRFRQIQTGIALDSVGVFLWGAGQTVGYTE
jgi:hypothetical protein